MNREEIRDNLIGMALFAIPVIPISLYMMQAGTLVERLLTVLALWVAAWALSFSWIRLLTGRTLTGASQLAAGLLLLYGVHLAGMFEAVGL